MAAQITRWRPDTCGCVVDLNWDDENDPPVIEPGEIQPCALHGDLPDDERYEAILAHNRAAGGEA